MSEDVIVGLIAAVPATLVGIAALVTALRANRKVDAVHVSINSRMSELLASVGTEQRAVGHNEGIEAERQRKVV